MTQIESLFATLTGTLAAAGLDAASFAGLSDGEVQAGFTAITLLQGEVAKCQALSAAEIARRSDRALGRDGLAWRAGHVNPEAMLQFLGGGSRVEARRLVEVGTMMAQTQAAHELDRLNEHNPALALPVQPPWHGPLGDAVTAGELTVAAGASIRRGLGDPGLGVTEHTLHEALATLVPECRGLNADQAFQAARHARDQIDAAGIRARAEEQSAHQYLKGWSKPNGMFHGEFEFDPEGGALFTDFLDQVTGPRRGGPRFVDTTRQAWAKRLTDDPRSTDRIAAEALLEVIRIAAAADPGTVFGGNRPAVKVIVHQGTLATRTGHGALEGHPDPLPLESVDAHLCDTGYVPIGFDDDGQCVNVGRDQRLFTHRQRQGLAVRDGGCRWPGCTRPPSWTEAHHLNPWQAEHGRTDIAQGILLCKFHHLLLHNRHWAIIRTRAADYWLVPPPDIDPTQTPIALASKSPLTLRSPFRLNPAHRREAAGDKESSGGDTR